MDNKNKPTKIKTYYFREVINTSTVVEENDDGLFKINVNSTVSAVDVEEGEIRCELIYSSLENPPYVDVKTFIPTGMYTAIRAKRGPLCRK